MSKAATNFFTMAVHRAQANFIAYAVHPGLVQTDFGNAGAKMQGMEKATIALEDSCAKIMSYVRVSAFAVVWQVDANDMSTLTMLRVRRLRARSWIS